MIYPAVFFMVIGMFFGVFNAFNTFVFPDYFSGEYIHFGRLRPIHVGHVLFLWLLSADVGLCYYFVPRLCGVSIWNPRLAYCSIALWWTSLVIGIYSYAWGTNSGWEYAELPTWVGFLPIKFMLLISWVLFGINIYMTVANRKFNKMYVSLWYIMGTVLWAGFTIFVGSFAINWIPGGISRVNASFFYIHNVVGLIFTPMGLATAYYFLPKLANVPIYSHRMSMVGFWSIAFVYAWIGAHHIIHGPMSQWLQTTAIIFSIWLFIPVFTVVYNLHHTLDNNWDKFTNSPAIRFIIMGNIFYLITCVQGPLMALRNINEITSKTDWVIGHSHISLFATFSFFAMAGVYYAVPSMLDKPLWSQRLARWHYSWTIWGSIPFILSLWIGGFIQGMLWARWTEGTTYAEFHSQLSQFSFLQTIVEMRPWWILRAIGGTMVFFASLFFGINIFNTILLKPRASVQSLDKAEVSV